MPRAKAAPSRKRALDPAQRDESPPDEAELRELVERAEIDGVKRRIASGAAREINFADPPPVEGLARITLDERDMRALCALHARILERLDERLASWGGVGDKSGRQRGYGYLPGGSMAEAHFRSGSIKMREYEGEDEAADVAANERASVMLDASELPDDLERALESVASSIASHLPARYASFVRPSLLVAAQPNLHRERHYLRPHLDEPLHDGFGVVIVTVAVKGDASILLAQAPWDAERRRDYFFALRQGQAYALASDARNLCLHGVLADAPSRESLNLRFGLHDAERGAPFSAWDEVEKHWPSARSASPFAASQSAGAAPAAALPPATDAPAEYPTQQAAS